MKRKNISYEQVKGGFWISLRDTFATIIGLITCELFIKISHIEKLQIKLGDNISPAVGNSFNVLIPVIFLYSLGNFLFTLGIHQTVIYGTLLEPLLIANINENMLAYAATAIGFMNPCVVYIPWTTPPLVNAYLATAGEIYELAKEGNETAVQIMEDTYEYLSNFLGIFYGVLDPEIFILSGSVALKIPGFEGEERYINEEGSNCFGYHAWTGIDCWSWNNAYKNRYGFITLDLETQKRTVKKSGEWLRKVTEEHGYIAKDSYQ